MFGCLECTCPDTVKLILKVWVPQRQIGIVRSKSECTVCTAIIN